MNRTFQVDGKLRERNEAVLFWRYVFILLLGIIPQLVLAETVFIAIISYVVFFLVVLISAFLEKHFYRIDFSEGEISLYFFSIINKSVIRLPLSVGCLELSRKLVKRGKVADVLRITSKNGKNYRIVEGWNGWDKDLFNKLREFINSSEFAEYIGGEKSNKVTNV